LKYLFKKNNEGAFLIAVNTRQVELLYNKIAVQRHLNSFNWTLYSMLHVYYQYQFVLMQPIRQ